MTVGLVKISATPAPFEKYAYGRYTYPVAGAGMLYYAINENVSQINVTFVTSDELNKKVISIYNKYIKSVLPDFDITKLEIIGWDYGSYLNGYYGYTFYYLNNPNKFYIQLSSINLPQGINDPNFEWVVIHELLHVYFREDPSHMNTEAIKTANIIESRFGINIHYN